MRNKISIYFGMIAGGAVLLWIILGIGSRLERSPFIGGEWVLQSSGERIRIEQSGRFLRVRADDGKAHSGKLRPGGGVYRLAFDDAGLGALPAMIRRTAEGDLTLVGADSFERIWTRPPAEESATDGDSDEAGP